MKERLDVLLVSQGLAASREKAKAIIMSGNVLVNGQREDKAGTMIDVKGDHGKGRSAEICQPRRTQAGKGDESF